MSHEPSPLRDYARHVGLWIVAIALIFVAWELVLVATGLPAYVIPPPGKAIGVIFDNIPLMTQLTSQTLSETFYGYIVGAVLGVVLAVIMAQVPIVHRLLYPALITSQAVPIVAIAAPLVIIFGFGLTPKLIIVAWIVFFPVVVNVLDGLASVDHDQINLARLLGGTRLRTFMIVRLPACIGPLFSGLKIGACYAVTGAVIGEWTASSHIGLGTYLLTANAQMNTAGVYGAMLLLTAIGIGSFLFVVIVEHFATPWRTRMTAPAYFGGNIPPHASTQKQKV
ncbi:ABC transporter permease [Acidisoma cellulosilytica]|uniref:ABC transporter permease n=1 Tax=Acidisoma cellulosilyticum TaxID=2802395 RepID=A0A964E6K1_9PROT|nr:ABC transporter permease [Acidisoma cellulosilyticum]MCB8883845.1 ABC transporter permease [Acidisoma cellulosilyticum]